MSHHFLPGGRYAFAALPALSAIPLNSAAVQALTVLTCEIEPAPDAAINAAITASPSLASEMSRKSVSPVAIEIPRGVIWTDVFQDLGDALIIKFSFRFVPPIV